MTGGAADGGAEVRRARTKKAPGKAVKPRSTPGRTLHRALSRKGNPARVEQFTDEALLRGLIGEEAARSVIERCGSVANLDALGGLQDMMQLPGVSEGRAVQLLSLWELAARISAGVRER